MRKLIVVSVASAGLVGIASRPALGATVVWDGEIGDGLWTTAGNWVGDVTPSADDALVFDTTGIGVTTNDFVGGTQFASLTFNSAGFTVQGNDLRLTDGVTTTHSSGEVDLDVSLELTADQSWNVAAGGTLNTGDEIDAHVNDLTIHADGLFVIGGTIGAGPSATLVIDGSGEVRLASDGFWLGPTIVERGLFNVGGLHVDGPTAVDGGILGGTGTVAELVADDGFVSPGSSPGVLNIANSLTLDGAALAVEIEGAAAGEYDQVIVESGSVMIGPTSRLEVEGSDSLFAVGQVFTLIDNRGAQPISGEFEDLPDEFEYVPATGVVAVIDYQGGDGNDLTISVRAAEDGGSPTTPAPTSTSAPTTTSGELPRTGTTPAPLGLAALTAFVLGLAITLAARRRRQTLRRT